MRYVIFDSDKCRPSKPMQLLDIKDFEDYVNLLYVFANSWRNPSNTWMVELWPFNRIDRTFRLVMTTDIDDFDKFYGLNDFGNLAEVHDFQWVLNLMYGLGNLFGHSERRLKEDIYYHTSTIRNFYSDGAAMNELLDKYLYFVTELMNMRKWQ